MTDETTTEQLAEIEGQAENTPATEYTPPDGWRVLAVGERLRDGDMTVRKDGYCYSTERVGGWVGSNQRYIRPIESQPQPQLEPQAADTPATEYTPPEGWRVVRFGEELLPGDVWVNWEGTVSRPDILHGDGTRASGGRYIRRIKPQPEPQAEPEPEPQAATDAELRISLLQQANDSQAETIGRLLSEARDLNMEIGGLERQLLQRDARIRDVETMHAAAAQAVVDAGKVNDKLRAQAEELRSEVSYVQRLLGESRQRVTQLEELVGSLRTINEGAEKAVSGAGVVNDSLRLQLAAVKAELASVAADRQQLRVELDAAQQVPADSPEIRQLRADLAEVIRERDQYRHCYDEVSSHLETIEKTAKAEAVEAIVEWLVPIRTCGSQALATAVISNLPHIMRTLTGLSDEEID